ncbi:hypothetical protein BHE74_00002255 [Ensete ventricosum]|nr:hypothetical protein BHE74_00002255 [Ensete ventricosum]
MICNGVVQIGPTANRSAALVEFFKNGWKLGRADAVGGFSGQRHETWIPRTAFPAALLPLPDASIIIKERGWPPDISLPLSPALTLLPVAPDRRGTAFEVPWFTANG